MNLAGGVLATSISVHGLHGVLFVFAALLFLVATIIAWFVTPRTYWATFIAGGLCLATLAMIVTGLP